jgi:hypothetical protein
MKNFTTIRKWTLLLLLISAPTQVLAASPLFQLELQRSPDSLAVAWPTISQSQLILAVDEARLLLAEQQQTTAKRVSKYRDGSDNYLLAAVMPGGMLYLAYQKSQLRASKQALQGINADITALADDRVKLGLPQNLQVARNP